MKIDDRNFEKTIQSKLAGHEADVRDDLWAAIESQLPKGETTRRVPLRRRVWWYSAAAVAVGSVLTLALWHTPNQPLDTPTISQLTTPQEMEAKTQPAHVPELETNNAPLLASARTVRPAHGSEQNGTAPEHTTKSVYLTTEAVDTTTNTPTPHSPLTTVETAHPAITLTPSDSAATSSPESATYRRQLDEFEQAGQTLKEAYTENTTPTKKAKASGIRLGLMAANATTGSSQNGPTAIRTRNPMMMAKRNPVYRFKHKMPLSAGVTVSKSLPKNWELESGLIYTYLYSQYYSTNGNGSHELHYVGIPLNVIYRFARINRFSFYASAGGQVDFYLTGRQKDEEHEGAISGSGYKELKHENVQFSVQANVGAALSLYKSVELYLEPYMAYYFENNSSIHNIWKDKPFNFGLTLGIRTGF